MASLPFTSGSIPTGGIKVIVNVEGKEKVIGYLTTVEQLNPLKDFVEGTMDSLYQDIKDSAPYDSHYYEEHIKKHFDRRTSSGYIETTAEYSRYIIYGGPTLFHTALVANARGIHWPYSRVVGNLGIIHDLRQIIYKWKSEFDSNLDYVDFSQGRQYTSSGKILPLRGSSGKWRSG